MPSEQTFLDSLAEPDRVALLSTARECALDAGEALFRHGDAGSSFAILLSGRFKILTRAATGRSVLLGLRGPGDLVGEIAVLDRGMRTADVVAVEPARAAVGGGEALHRLLLARPTILLALCQSLNRRLREADQARVEMAALAGHGRVAVRLMQLGSKYGRPTADGVTIAVPLSQDEIADWTGLSRPAVARALAEFRRAGLVQTRRRAFTLSDPAGLQAYAALAAAG